MMVKSVCSMVKSSYPEARTATLLDTKGRILRPLVGDRLTVEETLHHLGWVKHGESLPIGSMYGIYANIGGILMVNVTIYCIHGSYGL